MDIINVIIQSFLHPLISSQIIYLRKTTFHITKSDCQGTFEGRELLQITETRRFKGHHLEGLGFSLPKKGQSIIPKKEQTSQKSSYLGVTPFFFHFLHFFKKISLKLKLLFNHGSNKRNRSHLG